MRPRRAGAGPLRFRARAIGRPTRTKTSQTKIPGLTQKPATNDKEARCLRCFPHIGGGALAEALLAGSQASPLCSLPAKTYPQGAILAGAEGDAGDAGSCLGVICTAFTA